LDSAMALYVLSLGWGPKAPVLSVGCLWPCAAELDVVTGAEYILGAW